MDEYCTSFRSVLAVLGISPDSQTSSQAQTTQAPEGDTSNSDKEVIMEKTKESSSASWGCQEGFSAED